MAKTIDEKTHLVKAEVIAKYFDVHKRTVALWADHGDIPHYRIGGAIRFNLQEVIEYSNKNIYKILNSEKKELTVDLNAFIKSNKCHFLMKLKSIN